MNNEIYFLTQTEQFVVMKLSGIGKLNLYLKIDLFPNKYQRNKIVGGIWKKSINVILNNKTINIIPINKIPTEPTSQSCHVTLWDQEMSMC